MTDSNHLILSNRSVLRLTGAEVAGFLNRVLTCRTDNIQPGEVRYGALLTPQGKILTDLFVYGTDDGLLMDLPSQTISDTRKRLTMLKLRADAAFVEATELRVAVFSGANADTINSITGGTDPRASAIERHVVLSTATLSEPDEASWLNLRIQHVLPECCLDYAPTEMFPADVNMDVSNGVDFKKGCFVGQEVVSRMKRKTEVRKRTLSFSAVTSAEKGDSVMCGPSTVGEVLVWQNGQGLVLTRLDRLSAGREAGNPPALNGIEGQFFYPVSLEPAA